jgi:hypothetical protein
MTRNLYSIVWGPKALLLGPRASARNECTARTTGRVEYRARSLAPDGARAGETPAVPVYAHAIIAGGATDTGHYQVFRSDQNILQIANLKSKIAKPT